MLVTNRNTKLYCVLDTETATLHFANEICNTAAQKKKMCIAKPIVYDIGWKIVDRNGNVFAKRSYLVQETFFVPQVFNTAYYAYKRPIYMDRLAKGEIVAETWNNIIEILLQDLSYCSFVCAYNACFDFKRAIPFTERYIKNLYTPYYQEWENRQRKKCIDLINGNDTPENPDYLVPTFELRGKEFPIVDIWGLACDRLLNTDRYRDFCLKNDRLTPSSMYFSTSAETSYQYLLKEVGFEEEHTALSDAEIEAEILRKCIAKGKIEPTIREFPFRQLGNTYDYVAQPAKQKYAPKVSENLQEYAETISNERYLARIEGIIQRLEGIVEKL